MSPTGITSSSLSAPGLSWSWLLAPSSVFRRHIPVPVSLLYIPPAAGTLRAPRSLVRAVQGENTPHTLSCVCPLRDHRRKFLFAMLSHGRATAWLAALLGATAASAACSSDLVIDDFASIADSTNKLGSAMGGRSNSRGLIPDWWCGEYKEKNSDSCNC